MKNLLDMIVGANGGQNVAALAQQFGVGEGEAKDALQQLVPALSRGLQRNAKQSGGLENLLGALSGGQHARFLENPALLGQGQTVSEGNAILGHILGSKDVSRNVASHASQQTGLDSGVIKQMLPLVATMVMGAMSKRADAGGVTAQSGGNALSGLGALLDQDGDGSSLDDVLNIAKKLF